MNPVAGFDQKSRDVLPRGEWFRRPTDAPPWLVAHRGAARIFPENSQAAFAGVADLTRRGKWPRVVAAELDLQSTSDSVPVVFHDDTLERLTNAQGAVRTFSRERLSEEVRCADGAAPPFLPEVCRGLADSPLRLFVEIKDPAITAAALDILQAEGWKSRCVVGSFHEEVLRALPPAEGWTGLWLLPSTMDPAGEAEAPALVLPSPSIRLIGLSGQQANAQSIGHWRERGLAVWVYTVNSREEGQRLTAAGADALITDDPNLWLDEA